MAILILSILLVVFIDLLIIALFTVFVFKKIFEHLNKLEQHLKTLKNPRESVLFSSEEDKKIKDYKKDRVEKILILGEKYKWKIERSDTSRDYIVFRRENVTVEINYECMTVLKVKMCKRISMKSLQVILKSGQI
jgi:hypothetical protein